MKTILIVGLPASGKTFLAQGMADRLSAVLVDDPKTLCDLPGTETLIITDPYLCFETNRAAAERYFAQHRPGTIEWIFFANDPEQCLTNAGARTDKMVNGFVRHLSPHYAVPDGADVRPVYKPCFNPRPRTGSD